MESVNLEYYLAVEAAAGTTPQHIRGPESEYILYSVHGRVRQC